MALVICSCINYFPCMSTGFTQAIVQFDKSIFTLGVNPLSGDLTIGKLDLH